MIFRLLHPEWFWALVPFSFFAAYLLWKKIYRAPWFSARRTILVSLSFSCLIVALSRPQWGSVDTTKKAVSPSIILAIDISRSMLVEDILPNRLSFSTLFSSRILERLSSPRTAIFPFAASGFLLMPFTTDQFAIQESLTSLDPSVTSDQGTNFNQMLEDLNQTIQKQRTTLSQSIEGYQKPVILIFSDGESHHPFDNKFLRPFIESDIKIFSFAIGTREGGTIPADRKNQVRSSLQVEPLKTISLKTGGAFFSGDESKIPQLIQLINQDLVLTEMKSQFKVTRELFEVFVFLAFICLIVDLCFSRWQYVIRISLILLFVIFSPRGFSFEDQRQAIDIYNKGLTALTQGTPDKAAELFEESALLLQDPLKKKQALFNLGNAFMKMGDPEQAIESYQKAYRTRGKQDESEREANTRISDNIALAAEVLKQMKSQEQSQSDKEQGEDDSQNGRDPKGPQKFKGADLTDQQKQKLFDLIASEERNTQKRIREQNRPPRAREGKNW